MHCTSFGIERRHSERVWMMIEALEHLFNRRKNCTYDE